MVIVIPDDDISTIKWKYKDTDDWTTAEVSDLIKAYEEQRPQGEWVWRSTAQWCSECNALKPRKYPYSNYCPNCGAKMKGGTE